MRPCPRPRPLLVEVRTTIMRDSAQVSCFRSSFRERDAVSLLAPRSVTRSDGDMPKHEGRFDTLHSVIEKLVAARRPRELFDGKEAKPYSDSNMHNFYRSYINRRLRHAMEGRGVGGKGSAVTVAEG